MIEGYPHDSGNLAASFSRSWSYDILCKWRHRTDIIEVVNIGEPQLNSCGGDISALPAAFAPSGI